MISVRTLPGVIGCGVGFSIIFSAFEYTGGKFTGYDEDPNVDQFDRKMALRANKRRPIQETIDELGEGRGKSNSFHKTTGLITYQAYMRQATLKEDGRESSKPTESTFQNERAHHLSSEVSASTIYRQSALYRTQYHNQIRSTLKSLKINGTVLFQDTVSAIWD